MGSATKTDTFSICTVYSRPPVGPRTHEEVGNVDGGGELGNAVAQRELSVSYGVSARLLVCRYASGVVRGEDTRSKGQPWDSMDQAALDDNGVLVSGSEILLDGICQRREGQGGGGPVPAGPHVYGR